MAAEPVVYLMAIDATANADEVLELACGVARALPGPAEMHIVNVIGPLTPEVAAMGAGALSDTSSVELARNTVDRASSMARERFPGRVVGHLAIGEPWREIVQMATTLRADLVFVGTSGKKGVARLALGSVAEKVVRHAGCPVLVARKKDHHSHEVPQIEPPCPDCLDVQMKTSREKLWCARHDSKHPSAHLHYESPPSFGLGSMLVRP
ncbi:MAG: universal stress protein [Deltaproteobacteria bacterium]|nr:universal stress protein [Deltaproteobacteria bacterium]